MCTHTLAYKPGATEAPGQRELLFELGGGLLQNVFLIFSFPSASVDRTSLCAAFYWSQRQQAERSVKFSSFCPSFPPFPSFSQHALVLLPSSVSLMQELLFFTPPSLLFFLVHFLPSPLSLVPPLLLACLSLFSLPHFLCALQWFFRFFPTYSLPLSFRDSFHPTLCLFSLPHLSPLQIYMGYEGTSRIFFFSPQYLFSSLESLLTLQVMNCVTINMCGIMAN